MIYLWLSLFAAGIVAADQLTKAAVVARFAPYVESWLTHTGAWSPVPSREWVPLLPGILHITFQPNTGAAFSILAGSTVVFFVVTGLFLALVAVALWKKWLKTPLELWSAAAICGGAVGNLIDRVAQGFVVDMLEVEFMRFAVFNVADCFITVGAIGLVLGVLTEERKK